jgi:hypothetical protein
MLTNYGTYLVRCWRDGGEVTRVEVLHVQSGERVLMRSAEAALHWIDRHGHETPSLDPPPVV